MRKFKNLAREEGGSSAVQFALGLPVLLALLFGIIEFGRMLWVESTIEHAAAQGARYASVRGAESETPVTDAQIINFVESQVVGIKSSDVNVLVNWMPNKFSGSEVEIELDYQFEFVFFGFQPFGPVALEGTATMTVL
jgi:Flp pilus assembly protein TadG